VPAKTSAGVDHSQFVALSALGVRILDPEQRDDVMIEAFALQPSLGRSRRAKNHWGLSIGGVSLRVDCERGSDAMMCTTLQPFQIAGDSFDVEMTIESRPSLARSSARRLFDSGATWSLWQSGEELVFDFSDPIFGEHPFKRLLIDERFSSGTLHISESDFRRYGGRMSPLAYPLDELLIMHRLTQERAIELHGVGIVGPDGASNLFIGHSGAGKSTTARLWTSLHKVKILSDDRIIVRESPARELRPGDDPRQIFMYGTPWHGEGCFALPKRAPLQRIFVLEHGHGNAISRLTPSQAVGELFARAFVPFHRHEYIDNAITFLDHLVASVPCYRYSFEPDERAVERVLNFRD
jgi:hypothetical protein